MSIKHQLLDPLGTMCKLISLIFTEINTKISIQDHVLTLHKPGAYQFLVRRYNGDGRENISELYNVIIRIIKWYLIEPSQKINDDGDNTTSSSSSPPSFTQYIIDDLGETGKTPPILSFSPNFLSSSPNLNNRFTNYMTIAHSDEIKRIVKYVCNAFRQLQITYDHGNVVLSLQFFINLLEDALNGKFDESRVPKHLLEKEDQYETLLDYNKLKNLWEIKKLRRICELYENCFALMNEPVNERQPLINGYLCSISSILELTDHDFQKLIQNSNNG